MLSPSPEHEIREWGDICYAGQIYTESSKFEDLASFRCRQPGLESEDFIELSKRQESFFGEWKRRNGPEVVDIPRSGNF